MSALLAEHFGYLSDALKLRRYAEAIAASVREGDAVVDVGCGSGVLGLACLRAGARVVHFIDETAFLEVARRTVVDAGYGARASFHSGRAQQIELSERADVVVCDHVGYFGIDYGILDILLDARRRFLKPEGTIIPAELRLTVAAVESAACRALTGNWRGDLVPADYHWVGDIASETKHSVVLKADDVLTHAAQIATVLPGTEARAFFSSTTDLVATRAGRLDGIGGWFDCRLAADVWMTNSPLAGERIHRSQAFLPLPGPQVSAGETIRVTVMMRPGDHVISWVVHLSQSGQRFARSTWNRQLLSQKGLVRANPTRPAVLNARGRARRVVLSYCDGTRSAQAVQQLVLQNHPDLFPCADEVADFVAGVLGSDCQ